MQVQTTISHRVKYLYLNVLFRLSCHWPIFLIIIARISIFGAIINNDSSRSFPIPNLRRKPAHLNETEEKTTWTRLLMKSSFVVCPCTLYPPPSYIIYFGSEELKLSKEYNSSQRHAMHLGPGGAIKTDAFSQVISTNQSVIISDKRGHVQKAKGRCKQKVRQ